MIISGVGVGVCGRRWGRGEGTTAETTQTFTKVLTLGLNITLSRVLGPKVSIFVKV